MKATRVLRLAPVLAVVGGAMVGCGSHHEVPEAPTPTQSPCLWGQVVDYDGSHPGFSTRVEAVEYWVAGIKNELAQLKSSPSPGQPFTPAEAVLALNGAEALLPKVFQREAWGTAGAPFGEVEARNASGQKVASVLFEEASKGGYRIAKIGLQRPPEEC